MKSPIRFEIKPRSKKKTVKEEDPKEHLGVVLLSMGLRLGLSFDDMSILSIDDLFGLYYLIHGEKESEKEEKPEDEIDTPEYVENFFRGGF